MSDAASQIARAVEVLRAGGLVAFPTETVYGLGADATNPAAVRKIFAAKERPGTNPLIVHVSDQAMARQYARTWPPAAEELARRFWPGPLTLVVHKDPRIVPDVSAGLDTVGLRAPDHPLALQLLRAFNGPIAAPSANRSNRLSPTTAEHVRQELGDAADMVVDGGPSRIGIESTVLDLCTSPPLILRPGAITRRDIENAIGPIEVRGSDDSPVRPARSPGRHPVHYAPVTSAFRFETDQSGAVVRWCRMHPHDAVALFPIDSSSSLPELRGCIGPRSCVIVMPSRADQYARQLYAALREADAMATAALLIQLPPPEPQWVAVRDRLVRASRPFSDDALPAGRPIA